MNHLATLPVYVCRRCDTVMVKLWWETTIMAWSPVAFSRLGREHMTMALKLRGSSGA